MPTIMTNTLTCLWIQSDLDDISKDCIKSWIALGYHVNLYTYSKLFTNNISTNIHIKNANDIIPFQEHSESAKEHIADKFRFELFRQNQESLDPERIIWLDTDTILLRKIPTHFNYVSSQLTPQSGIYCCKKKKIANIGVMCFDGFEKVNWVKITKSRSSKMTAFQSKYLKNYEKEIERFPEYILPAKAFCPVHWSYTKELFTEKDFLIPFKYSIAQRKIEDILEDQEVYGIHLWRQIYKKKLLSVDTDSMYQIIKNYSKKNNK